MNNRLYSHLYLHSKNTLTLKKFSTFTNWLMEKPGNWYAIAKMWEKHLKKRGIIRNGRTCLLKISLRDSFQFLLVQITITWFLRKWNIDSKGVIQNNQWVEKINELLQTSPSTITWCIVPFKNWNLELFVSYSN